MEINRKIKYTSKDITIISKPVDIFVISVKGGNNIKKIFEKAYDILCLADAGFYQ